MRQKRTKAYKRLLHLYRTAFGFREPYQVLVDAEMVKTAVQCNMDLASALERTLLGKVKPMISQCCITTLYALGKAGAREIAMAKTFERRRCGHFGDAQAEEACISACLGTHNQHRYVVATQDAALRGRLRGIAGTPLIYIKRSVMILEPPSDATLEAKRSGERQRLGLGEQERRVLQKRKAEDLDEEDSSGNGAEGELKKKSRGPKGPNPLSVKKAKPRGPGDGDGAVVRDSDGIRSKKRRRKHKARGADSASSSQAKLDTATA